MAFDKSSPENCNGIGGAHSSSNGDMSTKVSPYATRAVAIRIGQSGVNYTIPEAIIGQFPALKDKIRADSPYAPIDLRQVDEDVGHTLVHFLYTGEYQTWGLDDLSDEMRPSAEFETCVLAYCAARACDIDTLAQLTQQKMDNFGPKLSVADMLHAMEEVAPKLPPKEQRLPLQMQSWLHAKLYKDPSYFTNGKLLQLTGRSAVFDTAVAKAVIELHTSALLDAQAHQAQHRPEANGQTRGDNQIEEITTPATLADNSNSAPSGSKLDSSLQSSTPLNGNHIGADNFTVRSDESIAPDTASDIGGGEATRVTAEELGKDVDNNGIHGGADNLKLTDDEGDVAAKAKSKKSKKKKSGRKDSVIVTSP